MTLLSVLKVVRDLGFFLRLYWHWLLGKLGTLWFFWLFRDFRWFPTLSFLFSLLKFLNFLLKFFCCFFLLIPPLSHQLNIFGTNFQGWLLLLLNPIYQVIKMLLALKLFLVLWNHDNSSLIIKLIIQSRTLLHPITRLLEMNYSFLIASLELCKIRSLKLSLVFYLHDFRIIADWGSCVHLDIRVKRLFFPRVWVVV